VVEPPKHAIVPADAVAEMLQAGEPTVVVAVVIHPLESVTVTVYVPAVSPVAVIVVCTGELFHEYVYGEVPPAGTAVAVPSDPPNVVTGVELAVAVNCVG
jgi:hypothetical protein